MLRRNDAQHAYSSSADSVRERHVRTAMRQSAQTHPCAPTLLIWATVKRVEAAVAFICVSVQISATAAHAETLDAVFHTLTLPFN